MLCALEWHFGTAKNGQSPATVLRTIQYCPAVFYASWISDKRGEGNAAR